MSLILEALRRSEAERRLGSAPDVLAPMPILRAAHRTRRWPWWTAFAIALVVLALLAVWRYAQHRDSVIVPALADRSPAASAMPQLSANAVSAAPPAIALPTIAPIATQPSPSSTPHAAIVNAAPSSSVAASAEQAATAAAARVATPPAPAIPEPSPIAAEIPPTGADALQSIADLSPAERTALPALKVSMHVYAEQPGDRFMIIDGARVGEGARIGDRIVLVQIRRDGGVLDIGGRRLFLPKP